PLTKRRAERRANTVVGVEILQGEDEVVPAHLRSRTCRQERRGAPKSREHRHKNLAHHPPPCTTGTLPRNPGAERDPRRRNRIVRRPARGWVPHRHMMLK